MVKTFKITETENKRVLYEIEKTKKTNGTTKSVKKTALTNEPILIDFPNIYVGKTAINNHFLIQPFSHLHSTYAPFETEHLLKLNTVYDNENITFVKHRDNNIKDIKPSCVYKSDFKDNIALNSGFNTDFKDYLMENFKVKDEDNIVDSELKDYLKENFKVKDDENIKEVIEKK